MSPRINQDLDEGQSGDPRALQLADIQAIVRRRITWPDGSISWTKANELGKSLVPTMAAATIVNFATGKTRHPASWTIWQMSKLARYRMAFVPEDVTLPPGSILA